MYSSSLHARNINLLDPVFDLARRKDSKIFRADGFVGNYEELSRLDWEAYQTKIAF